MSVNTLKGPALTVPRTYGELAEFLNVCGNHPARYANVDDPSFETFQDDERFLLHLRTTNQDSSKPLPATAMEGARAMIDYLEPSNAWAPKKVMRSLAHVGSRVTSGVRSLLRAN